MKQYLKMADVFKSGVGLDVQITCLTSQANNALVAGYIQHACESHDELVAEVERLSSSLNHANSNHELFERQYYLEKDKADGLQLEVEQLQKQVERLNSLMLERTHEPGPY